jgi:UDP-N-acetylmuramoyl-tripeptide--D-alanyl-D-alanine ligase
MGRLFRKLKRFAYFGIARYFRFWAAIHLARWQPTIITIIGSTGKTTLLHLFEAQLGNTARYSHKANSAYGIPFHILGLERKTFQLYEWVLFFVLAPFRAIRPPALETIYVTEADAERPGEAKFIAELLKPDILIWISLEEAHGVNFDRLVPSDTREEKRIDAVKTAMAQEFGNFLEKTKKLAILSQDNPFIVSQSGRTMREILWVKEDDISSTHVERDAVHFIMKYGKFAVPRLVPIEVGVSVLVVVQVMKYLEQKPESTFKQFVLPPSRSSVFEGRHNTTLIDSSYNATIGGMKAMLRLFKEYPAQGEKWLVLGDMIEQGKSEAEEHILLAELIADIEPDHMIFVGPRLAKYTYPRLLAKYGKDRAASFLKPGEAFQYLERELKGGETILFKGARYLEGVVERLLQNPEDASKLCRREQIWVNRRREWGI